MILKLWSLIMMRYGRWHDVLLLWHRQVLLTWFYWMCMVLDLEDAEASMEPLGLRIESGSVLFGLIYLLWYYIDLMIWCGHVLTRLLMMQADYSLLTRLTYGLKGPHTISREGEGEVLTTSLPQPTSTHVVNETIG